MGFDFLFQELFGKLQLVLEMVELEFWVLVQHKLVGPVVEELI